MIASLWKNIANLNFLDLVCKSECLVETFNPDTERLVVCEVGPDEPHRLLTDARVQLCLVGAISPEKNLSVDAFADKCIIFFQDYCYTVLCYHN